MSFRRCCDRPLPCREIDRRDAIVRGLDDHDVTIRRSATHPCISDWASAIGDGNDNVRCRRIARHRKRSSRAGSERALGSGGRLACPLVMLVNLGADKKTDDNHDECDSFFHENNSQRCASSRSGALFDGEWCEKGDDGLARLALFRMETAAQLIERDFQPSANGAFGNPGATSDFGAGEVFEEVQEHGVSIWLGEPQDFVGDHSLSPETAARARQVTASSPRKARLRPLEHGVASTRDCASSPGSVRLGSAMASEDVRPSARARPRPTRSPERDHWRRSRRGPKRWRGASATTARTSASPAGDLG